MIYRYPGNGSPGPISEDKFPALSNGRIYDLDAWAKWFNDKYVPESDDAPVA